MILFKEQFSNQEIQLEAGDKVIASIYEGRITFLATVKYDVELGYLLSAMINNVETCFDLSIHNIIIWYKLPTSTIVNQVKCAASELENLINFIYDLNQLSKTRSSSIAITHLETALLWLKSEDL